MDQALKTMISDLYNKAVETANLLRTEGFTDDAGDVDLLIQKIECIIEKG